MPRTSIVTSTPARLASAIFSMMSRSVTEFVFRYAHAGLPARARAICSSSRSQRRCLIMIGATLSFW